MYVWSVPQSCLTLCNPMDCNPPVSSAHGIFQARILQWMAISSSKVSSQHRDQTCIICISCTGRQIFYQCATAEVQPWHAVLSRSVVSYFLSPMDCNLPGFSVHADSPGKNTGVGCHTLPSNRSSWPRDWTHISCSSWIAGRFFTSEPPGQAGKWRDRCFIRDRT